MFTAGMLADLSWAAQGLAHVYSDVAYRDSEFVTTA